MLKYREALNLVLGVFYIQRNEGYDGYISLKSVLNAIDYQCNNDNMIEIAKYFEAKGYAKAIYEIDDSYLQLTTMGIIDIEDKLEHNIIKEDYLIEVSKRIKKTNQSKDDFRNPENINKRRKNILSIINSMKKELGDSADPIVYDLKIDIDILSKELRKIQPDNDIIKIKLEKMNWNNKNNQILKYINDLTNSINLY